MILFPRDNPVIENLNSYYVDIHKVFEHYQGQIDSGAVHFKAPSMEGVVFFDDTEPLSGMVDTRDESIHGAAAVDYLIDAVSKVNFTLSIFEIPPEKLFFWTRLPEARPIYDNLSAEFADLEGLAKKMKSEGLTGFIEVRETDDDPTGLILFENGNVLDVSSPLIDAEHPDAEDRLRALAASTRNGGASFSVRRIVPEESEQDPAAAAAGDAGADDFAILEELIDIYERAIQAQGKDFKSLFRRRCIANADRFDFLDPFVGEFDYEDKRIFFTGTTGEAQLTLGLLTSLNELADELDISTQIRHALKNWEKRWGSQLKGYDIQV